MNKKLIALAVAAASVAKRMTSPKNRTSSANSRSAHELGRIHCSCQLAAAAAPLRPSDVPRGAVVGKNISRSVDIAANGLLSATFCLCC